MYASQQRTPSSTHPPSDCSAANASVPFADEQIVLTRQQYIELLSERNQYKSLHERALKRERWYQERYRNLLHLGQQAKQSREAELIEQLNIAHAKIRDLQQRVFGKHSEKSKGKDKDIHPNGHFSTAPKRKKGHQPGTPSHGRTMHTDLPEVHEHHELPNSVCPTCDKPRRELSSSEDSSVIEIEVKGYVRKIHRHRYIQTCNCPNIHPIICAPVPPKLIPKGKYGVSVWSMILLDKYQWGTPTDRLLQKLNHVGLHIAPGTIGDGLQKIAPLFKPIDAALLQHLRTQDHWHADETRWAMFTEVEGKIGHRWYLWVFHSAQVVHYVLDQSRATDVIINELDGVEGGIISCDRYSAYKSFARRVFGYLLAFCWAHQRRDFLELANSYPEHLNWAFEWVEAIGQLYHLNALRLQHPTESPEFIQAQSALEQAVHLMAEKRELALQSPKLATPCRKVLKSMQTHWTGLTVFVRNREIPMDNNTAERAVRGAVIGRNNFFGSGAIWAGELAATLFSLFATLKLYGINTQTWMMAYLQVCAGNAGQAPLDVSPFLPWCMDEARLQAMRGCAPIVPANPTEPLSMLHSGGLAPPSVALDST
jgi:transposase